MVESSPLRRTSLTSSSSPQALSQLREVRPLWSSSEVIGPVRNGSPLKAFGRFKLLLSGGVLGLRRFLKWSCHLDKRSALSTAVIIPLERLVRPVNLLIAVHASLDLPSPARESISSHIELRYCCCCTEYSVDKLRARVLIASFEALDRRSRKRTRDWIYWYRRLCRSTPTQGWRFRRLGRQGRYALRLSLMATDKNRS